MLRVMPEASHASLVRRGESRLGRPDLYLLQWAIWMGLQGAVGLKVDCVSTEQVHNASQRKDLFVVLSRFILIPLFRHTPQTQTLYYCVRTFSSVHVSSMLVMIIAK